MGNLFPYPISVKPSVKSSDPWADISSSVPRPYAHAQSKNFQERQEAKSVTLTDQPCLQKQHIMLTSTLAVLVFFTKIMNKIANFMFQLILSVNSLIASNFASTIYSIRLKAKVRGLLVPTSSGCPSYANKNRHLAISSFSAQRFCYCDKLNSAWQSCFLLMTLNTSKRICLKKKKRFCLSLKIG